MLMAISEDAVSLLQTGCFERFFSSCAAGAALGNLVASSCRPWNRRLPGPHLPLCPNGLHQLFNADDVDDARQIVGQHAERHLSDDLGQRLAQEVRRTHPHLQRAERMLYDLAARTHGLRIFVEPLLRGFDNILMLPACNDALFGRCAFRLERAFKRGVCWRYDHHEYLEEKRRALELWERRLLAIVSGDAAAGTLAKLRS